MISLKPRSILQLTVCGFLSVTGLLVIALLLTAKQLDGLSDQSRRVINQSAAAMAASRALSQQAAAMERNARQYNVVGDREILRVYADRRQNFARAAEQLAALRLDDRMSDLLNGLVRNEALAFTALTAGEASGAGDTFYPRLLESTYQVAEQISQWTDTQLDGIRDETDRTKTLLRAQAILLVSGALILAGVFTALITRPLLQIERAIRQLGAGAYDSPIRVTGPRDLISLGGRLDWLRSRLAKLEKQRSSFLRHVSHELKTPLAAMQESAALLKEGLVGEINSEQKEILHIQSNSCQRLQNLIDDLLRYHAESFSVLNAMPLPVRLDKVVEQVLEAHQLLLRSERLQVRKQLDKVSIVGDAEQLRVVFDNLLTNALKFSPRGGRIELRLRQEADWACFDLQDEGPGIPEAERDKVFEAFYQGQTAGKPFLKGSGLGLSICQEYVHANGGSITVLGSPRGAHLHLRFPLQGRAAPKEPA